MANALRYSTNVLHVHERDSLGAGSGLHFNSSYLISQDVTLMDNNLVASTKNSIRNRSKMSLED